LLGFLAIFGQNLFIFNSTRSHLIFGHQLTLMIDLDAVCILQQGHLVAFGSRYPVKVAGKRCIAVLVDDALVDQIRWRDEGRQSL
jgi:hypothetical protein